MAAVWVRAKQLPIVDDNPVFHAHNRETLETPFVSAVRLTGWGTAVWVDRFPAIRDHLDYKSITYYFVTNIV